MLRLADADLLPFDPAPVADTVAGYAREVQKLADEMRTATEEENRRVRDRLYELTVNTKVPFVAPKAKEPVPFVNFAPLQNAVARLQKSAAEYKTKLGPSPASLEPSVRAQLNTAALGLERALAAAKASRDGRGSSTRCMHPVSTPAMASRRCRPSAEALELREWKQAAEQVEVVARTLDGFSTELERLSKVAAP